MGDLSLSINIKGRVINYNYFLFTLSGKEYKPVYYMGPCVSHLNQTCLEKKKHYFPVFSLDPVSIVHNVAQIYVLSWSVTYKHTNDKLPSSAYLIDYVS